MSTTTDEFIRVPEAKKRYLSGTMSVRWWYRQIEGGRLPHFRAGSAVVLRVADVEAFVAELYREKAKPADDDSPPPVPVAVAPSRSSKRGGLRFFN